MIVRLFLHALLLRKGTRNTRSTELHTILQKTKGNQTESKFTIAQHATLEMYGFIAQNTRLCLQLETPNDKSII